MVRVRFAPSPSGSLHIGSARTAIVNYLFAKSKQGKLVLRIEDTDLARSTEESKETILATLKWLGIDWEEGPIYQSNRFSVYQKYSQLLVEKGLAYRCFCRQEEAAVLSNDLDKGSQFTPYDGKCSQLSAQEINQNLSSNLPFVIRLKMPDKDIDFTDILKGPLSFPGSQFSDMIIIRSDGSPTYNFAVVVDDHLMEISHVIRGEDHLSNTPKQIVIYQAFGWDVPQFCHIPLILGSDKSKLSKRHGDTAIEDYQSKGFLPEAIFCYLSLLGYSRNPSKKIFYPETLISSFSLDQVSKSSSQFDVTNMKWMNQQFIKNLDNEKLFTISRPWLDSIPMEMEKKKKILFLSRNQLKILNEIPSLYEPFLRYQLQKEEIQIQQLLKEKDALPALENFFQEILSLDDFNEATLSESLNEVIESHLLEKKKFIQIIRIVVTGSIVSPPILDTLLLLGKGEIGKRFNEFKSEIKND